MEHSANNAQPQDGQSLEVTVEPDLLVIDVSGVDGRDARDGASFAGSSAPRARHGRSGASATEPEPGEDAGDVELSLSASSRQAGLVELEGRKVVPGRPPEAVREHVAYDDRSSMTALR